MGHEAALARGLFIAERQLHDAARLPKRRLLWMSRRQLSKLALAIQKSR